MIKHECYLLSDKSNLQEIRNNFLGIRTHEVETLDYRSPWNEILEIFNWFIIELGKILGGVDFNFLDYMIRMTERDEPCTMASHGPVVCFFDDSKTGCKRCVISRDYRIRNEKKMVKYKLGAPS